MALRLLDTFTQVIDMPESPLKPPPEPPPEQHRTSIQIWEPPEPPNSFSPTSKPTPTPVKPPSSSSSEEREAKLFRPRSGSHHLHPSQPIPPRWWLKVQAMFWRTLMSCSMFLHDRASPEPPKLAFIRDIPTKYDGPASPPISLYFYVPPDYFTRKKGETRYPVVVNFHGGGFSLGNATDDRYWANVVLAQTNSVLVSVQYRRAPEFPFPAAVDDCVDALLYLSANASDLNLDTTKIALSGFSAGANLAFSVPFRLKFHTKKTLRSNESHRWPTTKLLLDSINTSSSAEPQILNIIAFYPLLDWSQSRNSKRCTSRKPEKTLSRFFSNLFDYSYLPPSTDTDMLHISPFVSPGLAPDYMLSSGLPDDIQLFLCEYDMLLREGQVFANRLRGLGKNVRETLIPGVVHGWDKHPDPWRDQKRIDALYAVACEGLRESFGLQGSGDDGEDMDK